MSRWPTKEAQHGGYAGLCVGGPNDGMFVASQEPVHRVAVLPEPEAWDTYSAGPQLPGTRPQIETFVYQWVEGLKGPNAIDFFVPYGKTKEDALEAILDSYVRKKR